MAFVAIGTTQATLRSRAARCSSPSQVLLIGRRRAVCHHVHRPHDNALFVFVLDVQAIEMDPGASQGLSFTPGLELVFGQ